MRAGQPIGAGACLALALVLLCSFSEAREDDRALIEGLQKVGSCVIQSTFSFVYPEAHPPRNEEEMRATCRRQTEGFKCLREKTKGGSALVRRGLLAYVNSRTKDHRKYCTNLSSEPTRKFVEASKCIMEKRFAKYRENDAEFVLTMEEVARRNYTDSAAELKRICCSIYTFKRNMTELAGVECAAHKEMIEDIARAIVTDDLTLVCDDDDKLSKVCPQLEPLQFKRKPDRRFDLNKGLVSSGITIFLVATLGEPNDVSKFLEQ